MLIERKSQNYFFLFWTYPALPALATRVQAQNRACLQVGSRHVDVNTEEISSSVILNQFEFWFG